MMAATNLTLTIDESAIPVLEEVQGVCELLGLNPLYIDQGRFMAVIPPEDLDRALAIRRSDRVASGETVTACAIGKVRV